MVVDIGRGTTEVAVISLGGMVYKGSVRVGVTSSTGHRQLHPPQLRHADRRAHRRTHQKIGSAFPGSKCAKSRSGPQPGRRRAAQLHGLVQRDPRIAYRSAPTRSSRPSRSRSNRRRPSWAPTSPTKGIALTGGGALLRDLDRLLQEETGLPVVVADDPLTCVVRGCGEARGILKLAPSSSTTGPVSRPGGLRSRPARPLETAAGRQARADYPCNDKRPSAVSARPAGRGAAGRAGHPGAGPVDRGFPAARARTGAARRVGGAVSFQRAVMAPRDLVQQVDEWINAAASSAARTKPCSASASGWPGGHARGAAGRREAQLRRLLGVTITVAQSAVVVEVLYEPPNAFHQRLVFNKGAKSSLAPGMPVIDEGGVVGQIVRVTP